MAGLGVPGVHLWHVEVPGGSNHPLSGRGAGTEQIPDSWKCLHSLEKKKKKNLRGSPDAGSCLLPIFCLLSSGGPCVRWGNKTGVQNRHPSLGLRTQRTECMGRCCSVEKADL